MTLFNIVCSISFLCISLFEYLFIPFLLWTCLVLIWCCYIQHFYEYFLNGFLYICPKFLKAIYLCHCCSVAKSCLTLWDPMDCSTPGFPVLHNLPEFAQTHVHWVGDAIQLPHLLSLSSLLALSLPQHQGLLQWVCSLHQVAKVLELQLQHQSFQWILMVDFL